MTVVTAIVVFIVMLIIGVPIAVGMGVTAAIWLITSPEGIPTMIVAMKMIAQMDNFAMLAVPFFMLAGQVMERTGITDGLVEFSNSIVGSIRGGLSHTCTLTGMLMAGISGSGQADTAAIGNVLIPALKHDGYDEGYSAAIVAAAGGLGPIIPPSIFFIYYANAAQYSVGKLFMGGMLPGILMGIGFIIYGVIYAKRHNIPRSPFGGVPNIFRCFIKNFFVLLMPCIIVFGILLGIFTPTEAGVAAALYGIIYGFVSRRLTLKDLWECLPAAVVNSIGALMIVILSTMFGYVLTRLNVSDYVLQLCSHFPTEFGFYMFILVVCLIAGMFIDGAAIIFLFVPVLLPVVSKMGLDFQLFSMFFLLAASMNQLTPPVGCLLFIAAGITGMPLKKIIKPIIPIVIITTIVTILCLPFPWLVTWLPSLMG